MTDNLPKRMPGTSPMTRIMVLIFINLCVDASLLVLSQHSAAIAFLPVRSFSLFLNLRSKFTLTRPQYIRKSACIGGSGHVIVWCPLR